MEIKNIFGEPIKVTDLGLAIKEANTCLGFALEAVKESNHPVRFIARGDKQVTLVRYHSHMLNELLKLKPTITYPDWCFVGGFPTCISFCDKRKQEHGDYKTILRLFYSPLRIEIKADNMRFYPDILELAKEKLKRLQARVNEPLIVTASGQTTGLSLSTGPDVVTVKY